MTKFTKFIFVLPLVALAVACSDNDSPGDNDAKDSITDLSADEMANCYVVRSVGSFKFKADNRFNLGAGLPVPPEIHPDSAVLVWQSVPGSISSVEFESASDIPYIYFNVAKAEGNALIAALQDGDIVWSWHIWMPLQEIEGIPTSTGYDVMNMNLGALNNLPGDASSYGMLYQWGRKDPFPTAATLTGDTQTVSAPLYDIDGKTVVISNSSWFSDTDNTLEYSIANPTVCLSNYSHYSVSRDWLTNGDDALWGNPNGFDPTGDNKYPSSGRKTCYDPSPAGWRVAPADAFLNLTSSGGYAWEYEDFNIADINGDGKVDINDYIYGWHFLVSDTTPLYFPAAARFDGQYAMLMGSMSGLWGSYWSNSPYPGIAGGAFSCLSFQSKGYNGEDWVTVSPAGGASKADAFSVRCVRDIR